MSPSSTDPGDMAQIADFIERGNTTAEAKDSFSADFATTPLSGGVSSSPFHVGNSIRQQVTGVGYNNRSPLATNFTGGMFSRSGAFARTPNAFGSSPTCPRCGNAVYFAEQV